MKYLFFGTPRFADIILERLIASDMPPLAVICNPDRPVGRKKILTPPLTKQRAIAAGNIAVLQPERLDAGFVAAARKCGADAFVVAAYAKIIPSPVLDIPRLGTVGVHPSLLPRYRGASPIQSAILEGEKKTGVTLYHMDTKMDHGPVLASAPVRMEPDVDYGALERLLALRAADLFLEIAPRFAAGAITPSPQEESRATYTKKIVAEDGFVSEGDLADAEGGDGAKALAIMRKIRAFGSEPGVWLVRAGGAYLKLLQARILPDGALKLLMVQEPGQRPRPFEG